MFWKFDTHVLEMFWKIISRYSMSQKNLILKILVTYKNKQKHSLWQHLKRAFNGRTNRVFTKYLSELHTTVRVFTSRQTKCSLKWDCLKTSCGLMMNKDIKQRGVIVTDKMMLGIKRKQWQLFCVHRHSCGIHKGRCLARCRG